VRVQAVLVHQALLSVETVVRVVLVELMVLQLTLPLVALVEHMVAVAVVLTMTQPVARLVVARFASFGVTIVHSQALILLAYNQAL
jgi:hypothetical protein